LSYFEKKEGILGEFFLVCVNSTTNFWKKKGHKFDILKLKKRKETPGKK
jgi:hypothetical protein